MEIFELFKGGNKCDVFRKDNYVKGQKDGLGKEFDAGCVR